MQSGWDTRWCMHKQHRGDMHTHSENRATSHLTPGAEVRTAVTQALPRHQGPEPGDSGTAAGTVLCPK